ncbi:MAG: hypothetical protein WA071_23185 [Undibacterium umbellatum]|uniref:hypothetical protein n=1 Tax=Undibacterium umbellatum TaxID=2762300 RepID=UPI003BB6543A
MFLNDCARHFRLQAGGRPAATHFSCLAKKSKPKKATEASLPPEGGSLCCKSKNGKCPKLAALRQRSFLNPFSASQQRHRHIGTAKVNSNNNPKVKSNVNTTEIDIALNVVDQRDAVLLLTFGVVVAVDFGSSHV